MELLGERAVWSMSGGELLSELDLLDAEIAQLQTRRLHVVARVDETGYAQELGSRDTVELLAFRYRRDHAEAYRDVRLARALPKYTAVSNSLTHGIPIPPQAPATTDPHSTADLADLADPATAADAVDPAECADAAGSAEGAGD